MLEIKDLYVNYGNLQIIQGVSMAIKDGEMISLVGSNGAGKTTLLKAISGLKSVNSGSIIFDGVELTKLTAAQIVENGVVQVPEGRKLFPDMTVQENLELGAYLKGPKSKRKDTLEYVYTMLPDLLVKAKQPAGSLSGGQQQMVAIGRGLMTCPKLMIFDEPSIGLSPLLTDIMFDIIAKVKDSGVTIMLVEQNVQNALKLADRGYVLEQGKISMEGMAADLLQNEDLKKAYLGM
ncbi:MAG: ABC transporter ATP-binding protein [Lachnospiraceae bacterium]|nr:ABC transporter ATP-binding protein [Candidatus Merdinaster equi]